MLSYGNSAQWLFNISALGRCVEKNISALGRSVEKISYFILFDNCCQTIRSFRDVPWRTSSGSFGTLTSRSWFRRIGATSHWRGGWGQSRRWACRFVSLGRIQGPERSIVQFIKGPLTNWRKSRKNDVEKRHLRPNILASPRIHNA